jgi:hypothetical protein
MAQFQPNISDINDCMDLFEEIKSAQCLVQSMKDAMARHDNVEKALDHIEYLIYCYSDKIEELVLKLDQAFEKARADRDFDEEWKNFINGTNE